MKKIFVTIIVIIFSLCLISTNSNAASTLQEQIDNASPGSTINISENYIEDITINKDITLIGINNSEITGTITINNSSTVILQDLLLSNQATDYLLNIQSENTNVTLNNIILTTTGNGVLIDDNSLNTNLTINNSSITANNSLNGRALGIRGAGSVVNIENNSLLTTTGGADSSSIHINVGAPTNTATVNILNSTVNSDNYYAFFTWQGIITTNIKDSEIRGYAAIYFKPDSQNIIEIDSSKIIGLTKYNGESNGFGAIAIESPDNAITAKNGTVISNEFINGATSNEQLILFSSYGNASNNNINLYDVILQNTNNAVIEEFIGNNDNENNINVTNDTLFQDENKNPVAVVRQVDGTLFNAYTSFDDALNVSNNDSMVLQLFPGDYTLPNDETLSIANLTFLAFSNEVKEQAKSNFPDIALANIDDGNIVIYANSIELKDSNLNLKTNTSKQLELVFNPESTTDKSIVWQISDENIATISDTGLLTANNPGKTTLTITSNNLTVTYEVIVSNNFNLWIILIIVMVFIIFLIAIIIFSIYL